jgi:hypothetical protein
VFPSHDVATYFIDEKYDARDAQSLTEAEIHGREQARAYLQAIRTLPGCENAYILATGPEIGTRDLAAGRETLSVEQVQTLHQTFVTGLHAAFVVCAVLGAVGVVTALLRGAEGVIPPSIEHCTPRRRHDS